MKKILFVLLSVLSATSCQSKESENNNDGLEQPKAQIILPLAGNAYSSKHIDKNRTITDNGIEKVFVRECKPTPNLQQPKLTFPAVSKNTTKWIVPIYPQYHTELFPDSILNNESPEDFTSYLSENNIMIDSSFKPSEKNFKRLQKISFNIGDVKVSFTYDDLNEKVILNHEGLLIKSIPNHIITEIESYKPRISPPPTE